MMHEKNTDMLSLPFISSFKLNYTSIRCQNDSQVSIPDKNLSSKLKALFGKSENDAILKSDMLTLRTLSIIGADIHDLSGLEYAENLKSLDLSANSLTNIQPLSKLELLEVLRLQNCQLLNVDALANLPKLQELWLGSNYLKNIALNNNNSLKVLVLESNLISDISSLDALTDLSVFSIANNVVRDISVVSNYNKLETLFCGYNNIVDFSVLANKESLKILSIPGMVIADPSFLSSLSLSKLDITSTNINDLSYINQLLEGMTSLYAGNNGIEDINLLSSAINLVELSLSSNQIQDISSLSNCQKLKVVSLGKNQIKDVSSLNAGISDLYLLDNPLDSNTAFGRFKNLQFLNINNTGISKVNLPTLVLLSANKNKISDISTVNEKVSLAYLQDQKIELEDVKITNSSHLALHNIDGNAPAITWNSPTEGVYDNNKESLLWKSPGLNSLTWENKDFQNVLFTGEVSQYVDPS